MKRQAAVELLTEVRGHMVISAQVLAEFWVTVTRKLARPLSPEIATAQLADLLPAATVASDADLVAEAARLSTANQLSLWDAMILRAAVRGGWDTPYSEDLQHGFVHNGVRVVDPFRGS